MRTNFLSAKLYGCSRILLATPVATGWQEQPMEICVWEGIMGKLEPGGVFRQKYPARPFAGQHKFVVRYATGCLEGKPRIEAQCGSSGRIESRAFTVFGEENLILNVRCVGRELRATVFNQRAERNALCRATSAQILSTRFARNKCGKNVSYQNRIL